jgi:hypothetical protein
MKTFVHFDPGGSIHAIVSVDAPEGVTVMLEPEAGRLVAEIDAPKLEFRTDDIEKVREFAKQNKVVTPWSPRCKLTKSQ